jgi:membrane protein
VEGSPDCRGPGDGHGGAAYRRIDCCGVRPLDLAQDIAPGSAILSVWKIAQWPGAAFLLILALFGIYRFAPNIQEQEWKWLLPGSILAAAIWMAVSVLFKLYVRHFSHFGVLYGSLGALVILMFWFYLSGAAILAGGELNAILEDAAAKRRVPGAKRRGQRSLAQMHDRNPAQP